MFVFLGHISIGIYLIHFPIQCVFRLITLYIAEIDFSSELTWCCYVISVIGFAALYNYVIKNRFEPWFAQLLVKNKAE